MSTHPSPHGNYVRRPTVAERREADSGSGSSLTTLRDPYDDRTGALGILFALSRRLDLPFGVLIARTGVTSSPAAPASDRLAQISDLIENATRDTDAVARWGSDGLLIGCPATPPEGMRDLAKRLCGRSTSLRVGTASFRSDGVTLADLVRCANERASAQDGDRIDPPPPLVHPPRTPRQRAESPRSRAIKRWFDLSVVVATAPLWLPVLAVAAAAVKLSDPRAPVFFVQPRTGRGGVRFPMYKLRTMVPDAEQRKSSLVGRNQRSWPDFKIADDPRITRIGRVLRATSLDELPQLWNVLRGDMSLVGPRPTSFGAETYQGWQTARLEVIPGVTGLWQVSARNSADFAQRIRIDLEYVRKRGFLYDLKILLRTPAVLWNREGR